MTTEVGSASEVKKESDQLGADATKEKPKEVAENQQNQSSDPEEEKGSQSPPPAESQSSPRRQKKEKDPSESRGISRFIPPWLKKQKSYNLVVAKDRGDKKEPTQAVGEEQILDKEEPLPEEERQAKGDAEETAQRKQQEIKVDVKEEKPLPVEEVSKEREEEKVKEIQEDKSDEAANRETKEVQTNELKAEKASQKATKKTKTVQCKVTLLDGTEYSCDLEKRAKGQVLFDRVCEHLNLLEKDYFGLVFQENPEQKNWLDPAKEIKRQLRNLPWLFSFNVKFYPPDPSQLTEDITRYFLCLQLREDVASGRLPCSFVTHALLGSYTLQAELGDCDPEEHGSHDLSDFQFAPTQTKELEEKVAELHKTHRGLSPAQADSQFLENAKRLSMYGVDLHHAKDSEGVDIKLGVCANGLLIYKDRLRINRFAWPKILKISYKRSNFYIKVRPAELEQFESTIGFKLPNHRAAKRLWKVCVEHHTFYRLVSPEQPPKAKFLTLGSKFRYSGRTQAQTRQASTLIDRPAPHFERTSSKRVSRSLDGALIGIVDRSLTKDFPGPAGEVSARGPGAVSPAVVQDGDGSRDIRSPAKTPHVQLTEGKAKTEEEETQLEEKNSLRVEGDNIYVRHSNLMLEDLDKAQEEILKHQASISELKRNFMESTPEPRPNEWEKRRITPLSLQTQGSKGDHLFKDILSMTEKHQMAAAWTVEEKAQEADKSSLETLNIVEEKKQAEVGKDERVTPAEMNGKEPSPGHGPGEMRKVEPGTQKDSTSLSSESSSESEEEEDVGEYRPHHRVPEGTIREEQEECEEEVDQAPGQAAEVVERQDPVPAASVLTRAGASVGTVETVTQEKVAGPQIPAPKSVNEGAVKQDVGEDTEDDEQQKVNGEVAPVDIDVLPQIICCSEPPVVKTEMVTISDASQRTEISTKEVPIVQTETKTITYESPQIDGGAGGDSGTLLTAQTVTSESVSTTTTTHITKTVKGGISETRIEKRIVITGDADIDHDQALAQAIREAREQHPDMSVTRVVVHKETELDEGEE
ncbi:band 4.1-like protein 2 isoform X1 [Balaenoptera acutorostrata]|uniref:Band 4.1-like protein 2 isoform X1 n=1 Tax=Balaenoptera acutorostrata TaxID=9767 RepID=A0A384AUD5_BALAC|nr:band 4.1-like protein 2 isoform X1 [Balaenoptera acutorostrata]XP_057384181.1 band 4.1-like protein 2 isoform X1 [Balaenoptera acutorostrata]XP_057384182.1 band 4.1-like protein 2 isoform X1 [Balaenoptera acutorostrata]XP_057384183.1 band 4.1-like protein 2 isoform X1 [Balaenoptera acutorostrata]XP_057384184.1 band 4.1-like protein 2 isoform X1 [Balaenoptera acutorostrata]XP_057384185.1 band 4.1-like protein 2 isoform X1 [Balaenoptera acutorostrata]XP_057384186.1 band 4.1-like protein 2 is